MDKRFWQNRSFVQAYVGIAFLVCFILAMGKVGFGKPKRKDPIVLYPPAQYLSNTAAFELSHFDESDIKEYLSGRNFKVSDMSLHETRRCYIAYHYQALFDSVSVRTDISSDVLFAYFIMEATREGVESPMFMATWNPGGVKHRGRYKPYYSYDDCYKNGQAVPCAFESPGSFDNAVELWSDVFNHKRYRGCKNKPIEDTCECLYKAGYHTSRNYRQRVRIAKSYRAYQNRFPDA